jgi:hypothetical protein
MVTTLMALVLSAGTGGSIAIDSVKVEGPLPPAEATASVEKQLPSVSACVPAALSKDVKVTLKLTVMSDGQVSHSSISGGAVAADPAANRKFTDCLTDAADGWKFPSRKTAGVSELRVGLLLKAP